MALEDVGQIFRVVAQQPQWESYRQYVHLVEIWQEVVKGRPFACHTKVLYLSRQVLWVATSSAPWAQNLTMQRYQLRQELNKLLSSPLLDLRFSAAHWSSAPLQDTEADSSEHPSYLRQPLSPSTEEGFAAWVAQIRQLQASLPPCPRCAAPTPAGELLRWGVCRLCAVGEFDRIT